MSVTLTPVDFPSTREAPGYFDPKARYLAEIGGNLFVGQFIPVWYGWSFDDGWGCSGHQFDPPGENCSRWQRLWRIDGYVKGKRP